MTKTRKTRQKISDSIRKAIILVIQTGMSHKNIAKTYNISEQAVATISADFNKIKRGELNKVTNRGSIEIYKDTKKKLANMYQDIATRAGLNITDEKLKASSAAQLIMISGTAMDKNLLLKGESTSIVSHIAQKPTRELLKEFRKQAIGNDKDTEIILEQDGVFNKIKTIPVEESKHKDGGSNGKGK